MNEIKVSAAPVVQLERNCDKCGYALAYTHENTRAPYRDAGGHLCEAPGRYLDCPRQTCRHANRVPEIVDGTPAAPVVVRAPGAPEPKEPEAPDAVVGEQEDPSEQDCACATSVKTVPWGRVSYVKAQYHMFARRSSEVGEHAFFAVRGCGQCGGKGLVKRP
jgi:hypothetical protein